MTYTEQVLALLKWRWPEPMFTWELEGDKIVGTCVHDHEDELSDMEENLQDFLVANATANQRRKVLKTLGLWKE